MGIPAAGAEPVGTPHHRVNALSVMTRNLYLGADLTPLVTAAPDQLNQAVIGVLANVERSDPPARMKAVAAEIDHTRPSIVDLQEAADWTIAAVPPYTTAASYDFTALILQQLAALGDHYKVAVSQDNFDSSALNVQLPGRFVDRDVILVKSSVGVLRMGAAHFVDQLTYPGTPIGSVTFTRGYEWADLKLGPGVIREVNTHLEAYSPVVAGQQAQELTSALAGTRIPTVVGGDMNSDPAIPDSAAAAQHFAFAGYVDQYSALHPADPGYTCCRNATLTGGTLDQRIDHIYAKGFVFPWSATLVGVAPISATEPMWPSDHAGLVVRMIAGGRR